ncbi:MAG: hypothetical protein ACI87W_002683 [Halieaceae bacterium]|jgi:hypothetical protein
MRLILHIGTEKTGSTALQQHLAAHRDHLAGEGIVLADFLQGENHRALASAFMNDDLDDDYLRARGIVPAGARRKHREKLLRGLRDSLKRHRDVAHSYLVTSEHFHSRLLSDREVQRFTDSVAPLFDSVQVICYLRRQDRMALSFYTQKLRGGFIPPTILPVANTRRLHPQLPPFFDFESLLERWAGALGAAAIEPAIYSRSELRDANVVGDFYQRIGCTYPGDAARSMANTSLACSAQMALLAFNRAHGGDLESRSRVRDRRESLNAFLQRHASGPGILPSDAEAAEFLAAFEPSNRRVAQKWFGREQLFPADESEYPKRESTPDWATATALLAEFMALPTGKGDGH